MDNLENGTVDLLVLIVVIPLRVHSNLILCKRQERNRNRSPACYVHASSPGSNHLGSLVKLNLVRSSGRHQICQGLI